MFTQDQLEQLDQAFAVTLIPTGAKRPTGVELPDMDQRCSVKHGVGYALDGQEGGLQMMGLIEQVADQR